MCAAGGKARHIDTLTDGKARVLATDINAVRLKTMSEVVRYIYSNRSLRWYDRARRRLFDRVLIDAPCSALDSDSRRHPEIRWRRRPRHIEELSKTQAAILSGVADAVRPGGVLVYSVCTTRTGKGLEQVKRFLERRPDYRLDLPSDGVVEWSKLTKNSCLRLLPHVHGTDGFFAVRLTRQETP